MGKEVNLITFSWKLAEEAVEMKKIKVPCGKRDLQQGGVFGDGKREVLGLHGTEGGQKGYDGKNN